MPVGFVPPPLRPKGQRQPLFKPFNRNQSAVFLGEI